MDWLASLPAALFRLLSRLRRARALHPVGVGYRGRLEITAGARRFAGARLLSPGVGYDALVRFSRGGGLPGPQVPRPVLLQRPPLPGGRSPGGRGAGVTPGSMAADRPGPGRPPGGRG